jgi:proteic killer suppression protein
MDVTFRTRKLQREYEHSKKAIQAYGRAVARRYIERIDIIKSATDVKQLEGLPAIDCHPLKGDRKGEWSITLIGRVRLIFTLQGENLEIARIKEVSKHYGD